MYYEIKSNYIYRIDGKCDEHEATGVKLETILAHLFIDRNVLLNEDLEMETCFCIFYCPHALASLITSGKTLCNFLSFIDRSSLLCFAK